jgi:hypothetical protein
MAYQHHFAECVNSLKTVDYPKELLDIHVYTLFDVLSDEYKVVNIPEKNAYMNLCYQNYDYVWIINSDNIITEGSILKDCIDSQKYISSGLTIRKRKSTF